MAKSRINKYLAEHGYCSRREADRLIEAGKVFLNDQKAKLGDQVGDSDTVRVLGRDKKQKPELIYLMFHKPVGMITTTDTRKKDNVIAAVGCPERIFPVGRLDVESSGLLIMTNDGTLANRIMHPRYEHDKEYVAIVDQPLKKIDLGKLQAGVQLTDGKTLPAKVRQLSPNKFAIILREGKNRQIRRMCEHLGYGVVSLKRTRVLTLKLANFPEGHWRKLAEKEIRDLKRAVGLKDK
ncbi:rRNA pseudouridine synthase [Patescibacteria group bacterium]|nr:rRNA pseudouridine synthase [Patescibacteria group bacterium]MBU1705105.1 rRNA pseudouridine synthase [Patescibacteria group bacterium]